MFSQNFMASVDQGFVWLITALKVDVVKSHPQGGTKEKYRTEKFEELSSFGNCSCGV